jgi:cytochrome P450
MSCPFHQDPFKEARCESGFLTAQFQGKNIPMILRHKDLRKAAKDWQSFSSDAPFRVVIPSEEEVRKVRQLPIETDPPDHTEYRKLVEPLFRGPRSPEMVKAIEGLIFEMLKAALAEPSVEVVREFALPLQSRALCHLLKMPQSEADVWSGWGTHVFRDGGDGARKGSVLDAYIHEQLDRAEVNPQDDFFSLLVQVTFRGRRLTREEAAGFANLAFAGGRDTIINSVASIIGYFGKYPDQLDWLRENPAAVITAAEEFVRVVSPLTHIGRVCTSDTEVGGSLVPANERISLCWASANMDETVFENPHEVQLDRKPNPHVGFGSGHHNCLGAHHARLVIRSLLLGLAKFVRRLDVEEAVENVERESHYNRVVGYEMLKVRFHPIQSNSE